MIPYSVKSCYKIDCISVMWVSQTVLQIFLLNPLRPPQNSLSDILQHFHDHSTWSRAQLLSARSLHPLSIAFRPLEACLLEAISHGA